MRFWILAFVSLLLLGPAWAQTVNLTVEEARIPVNGRIVPKVTINGGVPGPTIRLREGQTATLTVTNKTREDTSIHWHGILLPGMMDGSPGFNGFVGIKPGASYTYSFKVRQSGTYWYHSHTGTQDQSVLGALVIDPITPSIYQADRDYTVLLSDLTHEDSDQVLRNLKADAGYYNYAKRTLGDFIRDAREHGFGAALKDRKDWGEMRMDPTDMADVTGYAFLANGRTPEQNETFIFKKGEKIRLRMINGSAMTFFDVRIPGLKMLVVAADGNEVTPVPVDDIRMGVAERYDVIVEPLEDMPYTLFAESMDRMGYARVTLAAHPGQQGEIPNMRPRATLNMADMGMGHDMAGMDHSAMDHSKMDHAAMGHTDLPARPDQPRGWGTEFPDGVKVLNYKDLKALKRNEDTSEPTRTITLRLSGNMERYVWTLDGRKFGDSEPIRVRYGERVRLTFVNETMMAHPMHLHGMFFEVENGATDRKPLKDTIIVRPGQTQSVVLTARETGGWPLHCHLLYHMVSGMMTTFVVEPPNAAETKLTPDHAELSVPMNQVMGGQTSHAGHGGHQ
jgi:FtsP/CotA-like multicopper oxidase with cupredoxin domain